MSASQQDRDHAVSKAARVFSLLKQAAESGEPCPSNVLIAESIGYASGASASKAVDFLETSGMIRVTRQRSSRIVTIVATGKTTAQPTRWKTRSNSSSARVDAFAEHLADGKTIKAAGHAVGVNEACAHVYLKRIKAGLGWQAA